VTGYIRTIKSAAISALKQCFEITYPEPDASGAQQPAYIAMDFPVRKAHYPGIWIDYDEALCQIAGIAHTENDASGNVFTRWRFQGHIVIDVVALSSNERDMIVDEIVALTAFAAQSDAPSAFRNAITSNTLVNTTWSFEKIEGRGSSAGPGTPWNTDEWIYERGFALQVTGDFVTDPATLQLVPLEGLVIVATPEDGPGPMTLTIR
jgi:hypothetical protein